MKRLLFATAIPLLLTPAMVSADIVILQDGTRLMGRVEKLPNTDERIAFISGSGRIEFPTSRIREIIEEPDEVDWTRVGNQFLDRNNFSAAVQHFQLALEANPEHQDAIDGLKKAQDAIDAQQEERNRELREQLSREMESVPELIELQKFTEAEQILDRVLSVETNEEQRLAARRMTRDLFLAWGFSRFDRLDMRGAEEKYQRVLEMDPQNEEAREKLLLIWRDDPTKRAEVLKAYQAKLEAEPNNLQYNRIVGDLLYDFQRYDEAIPHFKKVAGAPAFRNLGYDNKLVNAYQQTISQLTDAGELDEAIKTFQELIRFRPNIDTTNLVMLEYRRDRDRLAEDDWDGRALLVNRLLEIGLTRTAEEEAELILRYDGDNEIAEGILRQLAANELASIQQSFNQGHFRVTVNLAERFMRTRSRFPDMVSTADELMKKSQIQAERDARAAREQAREIAQRGIDSYNEALRSAEMMQRTDVRQGGGPISHRQRAIEMSRRAVDYMEAALRIDPSLGELTGMDLNTTLRDARALNNRLTQRPVPLPRSIPRR